MNTTTAYSAPAAKAARVAGITGLPQASLNWTITQRDTRAPATSDASAPWIRGICVSCPSVTK